MKELDDIIVEDLVDIFETKAKIRETRDFVKQSYEKLIIRKRRRLIITITVMIPSIAAVFILSLMILPSMIRINTEQTFNNTYRKFQVDVNTRSTETSDMVSLAAALYNQGNYMEALTRLDSILKRNPLDIQALFIKGLSEMEVGQYDSAVKTFNQVVQSGGAFEANSQWYLALIYLKQGSFDLSREKLAVIKATEDNPYQKQAAKIYRRLRFRSNK